jgi:TonB-linked SusC/RagA family outer membrane protein
MKFIRLTPWRVGWCLLALLGWLNAWAQQTTVRGTVRAANGEPVIGASVALRGTTRGAVTDAQGAFTLTEVPANALLTVSSVGYQTQEVRVGAQSVLEVVLQAAERGLDEVVVVGYGTRRRVETTGAIASVKAEELQITPNANVAQGLQGRVAGVQITQNSGAPGGSVSVRIRGTNSINGTSEPLYVIDGVQFYNTGQGGANDTSPLSLINPNDIESVEVLKDAASTAIYGARAANGVVLITTKRGGAGQATRVTYDGYYGSQAMTKRQDMLNAREFAQLENEIYRRPIYADPSSLGEGTDWQRFVFRTAPIQNHQLSLVGGSEKTSLALSGNYFDQVGTIVNSGFKRYSLRLNLDHQINRRVRVGTSLFGSFSQNKGINTAPTNSDIYGTTGGILGAALAAPPTLVPYREDGSVFSFRDQFNGFYSEVVNPAGFLQERRDYNLRRTLASVFAEVTILDGLTYRAQVNGDFLVGTYDAYGPRSNLSQTELLSGGGNAFRSTGFETTLLHESILTYRRKWAERHSLTLTGVVGTQSYTNNNYWISATNFPNDATTYDAVQLAQNRAVFSNRSRERLDSYLLRANYGFRDRYFLDLTARADGSSKFGANNKYGFFPAIAAAWRVIEEPFLKDQSVLSDLKLRASYGVTGNAGAIGPYGSLATVANIDGLLNSSNYWINHTYQIGIRPTGIPNPDLRWERSTQTNLGLDLSILNGRLNLTTDLYQKRTDDLLFVKQLPISSGYGTIGGNFAAIENRGIELALNGRVLQKAVVWDVSANLTVNRNKILTLDGVADRIPSAVNYAVLKVGQPLGMFYTYVFDGIYQSGEAILPGSDGRVGGYKVRDLNGDGRISSEDQTLTGNPNPRFIFGFNTTLRYKGFDFVAFVSGVQGNQIYNALRYNLENPLGQRNLYQGLVNRWSPTNPSQEYASGLVNGRLPFTDRFIEDGSFVRVRTLSLGYTLPKIGGVQSARVYLSGNNLFTLTRYTGFDPEVNSFGGSNTVLGVDNGVYPVAKTVLAGVQVTF